MKKNMMIQRKAVALAKQFITLKHNAVLKMLYMQMVMFAKKIKMQERGNFRAI